MDLPTPVTLTPGSYWMQLYSTNSTGMAASISAQGSLCIGGNIGRFLGPGQILSSGAAGEFSLAIDLTMIPQGSTFAVVSPGETWNYQAWFRDGVGLGFNFTDGLEITYQ